MLTPNALQLDPPGVDAAPTTRRIVGFTRADGERPHAFDTEGRSEAARRLRVTARSLARHRYPVLILGELGVGKLRFARLLHALGPRPHVPLQRIDCTSSELDAALHRDDPDGATLLLEHVEEAPPAAQRALAKFLGCAPAVRGDVRILATTRRDLSVEVLEGRMISDLYFRLRVLTVEIPPLRGRREDVAPIAHALLDELCRPSHAEAPELTSEAVESACAYPWPGNVRQLRNELARCVARGTHTIGKSILEEGLDERLPVQSIRESVGIMPDFRARVEAYERSMLTEALRATQGNRNRAAALLGVTRRTLQRKLAEARRAGAPLAAADGSET